MLIRKRHVDRTTAPTTERRGIHPRTERRIMLTIAFVLTVVIAASTFWGGGYFWIPLAMVVAVVWGFYYVLSRAVTRNPLHQHRTGFTERYADGQPLGRSQWHEGKIVREREEEDLSDEERVASRYRGPREPPGVEGPPPQVPFP